MRQKLIHLWPLILLIIFSFILRIYKLEELFYFTYDESIPAFVGRRLILWQHIPLIGGVTPFNFHLGPYFYWFYAIVLFFGKLNPIAWGWVSALIAMTTTLMMYVVGKNFYDKKVGLIAAAFWAFSFLANVYDRHLWALYWGPLVSLIVLYSLYKIISPRAVILSEAKNLKESMKTKIFQSSDMFVYLLGLVIALAIHTDPSNLVFLLLAVVVWIIYKIPIKKSTFFALGLIIFSFLPLVVFDLRHDFANTRPVIEFWRQGRNTPGFESQKFISNSLLFPQAFTRFVYTFGDSEIVKQYSYCRSYVNEKYQTIPWYFIVLSSVILMVFVIKHLRGSPLRLSASEASRMGSSEVGFRLIALLITLYFLGIQLYGTIFRADIFEHYITGSFAVFLLIFAKIVGSLPKNLCLLMLSLFIVFNLYKLLNAKNSMGLKVKKEAIEFTMREVSDKPFSLDSLSTCWKYSGYRYLFAVFGKEPIKSYVDPNFAYLYGTTPVAERHPPTVVTFVIHDFVPETENFYRRYALLKSHEIKSSIFGNIEVIILDNSSDWFD